MADALGDDFAASDVESIGAHSAEDVRLAVAGSDIDEKPAKRRVGQSDDEETEEEKRRRKKRKMKVQDKNRKAKKAANQSAPNQVAEMPSDLQADHLLKMIKSCKKYSKITDLELDEIAIRESMLLDTTSVKMERTEANIALFVNAAMPSLEKIIAKLATIEPSRMGQPVILVITGNAQRAADLAKALRKLSPPSKADPKKALPVGKLFARHFKIAEQEAFLKSNVCPIAIGTPQRVHDLLNHSDEDGKSVLKLNFLKAIILDASWTDMKMRTVLDNAETKEALCSLLASAGVQSKLQSTRKEEKAVLILF
ncbi:hypothetical protein CBS101457_001801 [Exobasidium rhododendri]|nr:hypothetical protein CBS101457_001801 [Exobasidium rhododendri]